MIDIFEQAVYMPGQYGVAFEPASRRPHGSGVERWHSRNFHSESPENLRVRVKLILGPAVHKRPHHTNYTGTVDFEVTLERPQEEGGFLAESDMGMAIVEPPLPMNIRSFHFIVTQEQTFRLKLRVERCTRRGRIQHELMKFHVVTYSPFDRLVDVLRCVLFKAYDTRTEDPDAIGLDIP